MKQSDLFRENANSCLLLEEKATDHGFVRILQTRRPIENGVRSKDGYFSVAPIRSAITAQQFCSSTSEKRSERL
jgi:hypothetical protein